MKSPIPLTLLYMLLLFIIFGLSLTVHVPKHSLEKRYNQYKYLDALEQKQDRFQNDLESLSKQIENIKQEFNETDATDAVTLSKVQQGIAEQRDTLYNIQEYLKLPFELKACKCHNFTKQQREQMKQKLGQLEDSIEKLSAQVRDCVDCPLIVQIKRQIQKEKRYISIMKEGLSADCCRTIKDPISQTPSGLVNTNQSLFKDNLGAAQNWYYGNMTIDQYVYKTFEATTKYNMTACSDEKPFALSNYRGCTFCSENKFFNLEKRVCEECGNFQAFDVYIRRCVKVQCKQYQQFSLQTRKCQKCPVLRPIFDNKTLKCQPCPKQQAFDQQSKQCKLVKCEKNYIFNENTKQCQKCPYNAPLFNIQKQLCEQCPFKQAFNNQTESCEQVNCMANQWYNQTLKKCLTCPNKNPIYNATTNKCDACPKLQVFNLTANKCMTYHCPINQIFNVAKGGCEDCPRDKPVYDSIKDSCEACPLGSGFDVDNKVCFQCQRDTPQWNVNTYQCEACPSNAIWNQEKKICMKVTCPKEFPNFNRETLKCEVCGKRQIFDQLLKTCRLKDTTGLCPPQKPIYDSSTYSCRPCPENSLYNKERGECEHDCKQGEYFNWKTGECNSVCTAPLIYNKGECKTKEQIAGCASQDQYYDRKFRICLPIESTCDVKTQYYDKNEHICKNIPICSAGFFFSKDQQKCQLIDFTTSPDSPNLIFNKPFSDFKQQYQQMKEKDPRLRDCPRTYPYFEKEIEKCIKCPDTHPYFNIMTNKCQDCGGKQYDASKHACETLDVDVSPTLERLIMNIV